MNMVYEHLGSEVFGFVRFFVSFSVFGLRVFCTESLRGYDCGYEDM